jgi:hypothetical protein
MIKIQSFTHSETSDEGTVDFNVNFEYTNQTKEDCDLVQTELLVKLPNGVTLTCYDSIEEVSIAPDESQELFASIGWGFHESIFNGLAMDEVKLFMTTNAYSKEFQKIGSFPCPEEGECNFIDEQFKFGEQAVIEGILFRRASNNEEGEVEFDTRVVMQNLTDTTLAQAVMKVDLIDKKGENIGEADNTGSIRPNGGLEFTPNFWSVKPSQLKGASLDFSASCYHTHLGKFTAESQAVQE